MLGKAETGRALSAICCWLHGLKLSKEQFYITGDIWLELDAVFCWNFIKCSNIFGNFFSSFLADFRAMHPSSTRRLGIDIFGKYFGRFWC